MDAVERHVIYRLASGDQAAREEAIRIHRNHLTYLRVNHLPLPRNTDVHFDFMSEVDNPCPDLVLRSMYRKKVIEAHQSQ